MFKVVPINMVLAPNHWVPSKDAFWTVTGGQAIDLWGELVISDSLGDRPYVPASGASLTATFQRGDFIGSTTNKMLTVTKPCQLDTSFRALFKIQVSAQDATNIISGTVIFDLTEGGSSSRWTASWLVKKLNTSAGF
jgi:hypothetical protein